MQVAKRYFNTSGPNIRAEHYTLEQAAIVPTGLDLVHQQRFFRKEKWVFYFLNAPLFTALIF